MCGWLDCEDDADGEEELINAGNPEGRLGEGVFESGTVNMKSDNERLESVFCSLHYINGVAETVIWNFYEALFTNIQ